MSTVQNKFDAVDYQKTLIDAGVEPSIAMAHLKGLTQALEQVVIVDKLDQVMERHEASMKLAMSEFSARVEAILANQNTKIEAGFANQNTKIEAGFANQNLAIANQNTKIEAQTKVFVGILALFLTIMTAVVKFL